MDVDEAEKPTRRTLKPWRAEKLKKSPISKKKSKAVKKTKKYVLI